MNRLFSISGIFAYAGMLFLNAFVDLGHKITIQNTVFKIYDGQTQIVLTAVVNGLILLPFILLFSPSGFLSDRFPKHQVMRYSAWAALGLTTAITVCYYLGLFWVAFAMTFGLALQSAIYSPAKYGYLKELVGKERLSVGNALVQATTTVSILLGIFCFSVLFEARLSGFDFVSENDIVRQVAPIGFCLMLGSILELVCAYRLPLKNPGDSQLRFEFDQYRSGKYFKRNFGAVWNHRVIWLCIVGLAIFWAICQATLAIFPAFAKEALQETDTRVIQGLLACAGIGIVAGSVVAGRMSRNYIETGLIPIGAFGVTACVSIMPFLSSPLPMAITFVVLGASGGLFIVPLNSLIQFHAAENQLARVLAGNNLVGNVVMLSGLILTSLFAVFGLSAKALFYGLAVVAFVGAVYTLLRLPQSLARFVLARALGFRFETTVLNYRNIPESGGVLLLGNHVSFIDWALVSATCPRPMRFVMYKGIYAKWYLKWLLDLIGVIPIASGDSKAAIESVRQYLQAGEVVCIFPEGALTRNGQLGLFRRGFERMAEGLDVPLIPFYLHGLWGSAFSRAGSRTRQHQASPRKRRVVVNYGSALPSSTTAEELKQSVFDLGVACWYSQAQQFNSIPVEWLTTAKRYGARRLLIDTTGQALTNYRFLAAVLIFSRMIRRRCKGERVGIILPSTVASAITNMATLVAGKAVINLNYTADDRAVAAAIEMAGLTDVIVSRKFLKRLADRGLDKESVLESVTVHALEDLGGEISSVKRLAFYGMAILLPQWLIRTLFFEQRDPSETAAILFSSGSEGLPKAIELSHSNLLANVQQSVQLLDFEENDTIMATLPVFHAFGLTVTVLLPLCEGVRVVYHPDPTDVVNVSKTIAREEATVLIATATFLRLYVRNKKVEPLMLDSLRLVIAGAERLTADVRDGFRTKFGKEIYEGYGATELSPVIACNIPDQLEMRSLKVIRGLRPGTVGMPLPGTTVRVCDPVTLEPLPYGEEGLILVAGPQVMRGYLNDPDKTSEAIVEFDGMRWYRTGDKGRIDSDGFVSIVDRYSRFAKLGGEMVSLGAVEDRVLEVLGNSEEVEVAAINLPDARKGERIMLLVNDQVDAEGLRKKLVDAGMNTLMIPSEVVTVESIPTLGTGKRDFGKIKELAQSLT